MDIEKTPTRAFVVISYAHSKDSVHRTLEKLQWTIFWAVLQVFFHYVSTLRYSESPLLREVPWMFWTSTLHFRWYYVLIFIFYDDNLFFVKWDLYLEKFLQFIEGL